MGLRLAFAALVAASLTSCGPVQAALDPPEDATMVLFDVSKSTKDPQIRERYMDAFDEVLGDAEENGGYIAADIIDDNPAAHSAFTIKEKVDACGLMDNSLQCEQDAEDTIEPLSAVARSEYEDPTSRGTDVLGALFNAEKYLQGLDDARDLRLVILSDMVQSSGDLQFSKIEWSHDAIDDLIGSMELPDLNGVSVYVVGAGATAPDKLSAEQISWMEAFWGRLLETSGADVESYAATLHSFP